MGGGAAPPAPSAAEAADQRFKARHGILFQNFESMTLEHQMEEFICTVTMDAKDHVLRDKVLHDLNTVLKPWFRKLQLHPFGSLISGLGEKDSDLDVFVDCYGDAFHGGPSKPKPERIRIFKQVLKALRSNQYRDERERYFRQVIQIPLARVPIIKFVHIETSIHCDVSFENMLSIRNSQLIQFLVDLDLRVRPLTCLIRYWGKFYQLTDSLKIKNYAMNLLVVVFLTRKKILPSIYQLQNWGDGSVSLVPEFRVDFWNAAFYTNKEDILTYLYRNGRPPILYNEFGQPTALSLMELALEFFQFCAEFPAKTHILCTLTSQFIPRLYFLNNNEHELPNELNDYKIYCASETEYGSNPEKPTEVRRLFTDDRNTWIIQDPFALNFNVGAVTSDAIFARFIRACQQTATNLSQLLHTWKTGSADGTNPNIMSMFDTKIDFTDLPQSRKELKLQEQQRVTADAETTSEVGSYVYKTLELKPEHSFKDAVLHQYGPCSDLRSVDIIFKGKALWVFFMKDFFRVYFSKCFGLKVEIEEKEVESTDSSVQNSEGNTESEDTGPSTTGQNSPQVIENVLEAFDTNKVTKKISNVNPFLVPSPPLSVIPSENVETVSLPIFTLSQSTKRRSSPDPHPGSPTSNPPPAKCHKAFEDRANGNINQILTGNGAATDILTGIGTATDTGSARNGESVSGQNLLSLPEESYKPFQLILHCSGQRSIWEGRKTTLRRIKKLQAMEAEEKNVKESGSDLDLVDPMDIEAEITKHFEASPAVFNFEVSVKFEPSVKVLQMEVELKFHRNLSKQMKIRAKLAIGATVEVLPGMHEKYVMFRLAKWFQETQTPVKPPSLLPQSASIEIDTEVEQKTETDDCSTPTSFLPNPVDVHQERPLAQLPLSPLPPPYFGFGRGRGNILYRKYEQIPPPSVQFF